MCLTTEARERGDIGQDFLHTLCSCPLKMASMFQGSSNSPHSLVVASLSLLDKGETPTLHQLTFNTTCTRTSHLVRHSYTVGAKLKFMFHLCSTVVLLCVLGYYSCLPRFVSNHSMARHVHPLGNTIVSSNWLPHDHIIVK